MKATSCIRSLVTFNVGGSPTARDRVLASRMGAHAVKLLKNKESVWKPLVSVRKMVENPILGKQKKEPFF